MKRQISGADHQKLTAEIERLGTLTNTELKARWEEVYGTTAPARMKPDLLKYAVAYRLQERALGGLKPSTGRLLERVADDAHARRPIKVSPVRKLAAGTVLLRKWGGVDHQVTVLETGVLFRGKQHRSLSEIAHLITGSRWSGPLFFGLKAQAKEASRNGAH